jgi:hypothetical protein
MGYFYIIVFQQLQTHSLDNKTKRLGSLEPTCKTFLASFSCFLYVSFLDFLVVFHMFCLHRKVSLVRFLLVCTSSCTFLQCFVITCEIESPNRKLLTTKSFKLVETCAMNVVLSP